MTHDFCDGDGDAVCLEWMAIGVEVLFLSEGRPVIFNFRSGYTARGSDLTVRTIESLSV